jgi:hypothetical protein
MVKFEIILRVKNTSSNKHDVSNTHYVYAKEKETYAW